MFLIKREPKKNENIFLDIETVEQMNYIDRDQILNRLQNVRKGLQVEPLKMKGSEEEEKTEEEENETKEEENETKEEEKTEEEENETKPKKRFTTKQTSIQQDIDIVYSDESFSKGKGKGKSKDKIKVAHKYYKPNQPEFIEKIKKLFDKPTEPFSCDKIQTQLQQKVIVDYLNLYSPYRGLLVYHGIGSGKTCISIAVAEGLKSEKQIIVMVPEALKTNFFKELKKCGDENYRTNQRWAKEIVSEKRDAERLSKIVSLTPEYILEKGVWLSSENAENSQRFEDIPIVDQEAISQQVDLMIRAKYSVIGYDKMTEKTFEESSNPFDNCVVIIDEVHNFVCQIASDDEISTRLYQYLMGAQNCKLVFLTGSPIINHPHEIAILFNMLRGYIKSWSIPVIAKNFSTSAAVQKLFSKNDFKLSDKIEYKDNKVIITRNPYGFISVDKESAVILDETGNLSDDEFIKQVIEILGAETTHQSIKPTHYKLLPDSEDKFQEKYIEQGEMIERDAFQRRILGLTSYFNTHEFASENLPRYDKHRDLMVVRVPMSEYQTSEYEKQKEKEKREACNFVFPASTAEPLNLSKDSLTTLSPKLLHLLENIEDGDGLHLVYSEVSCDIIKQILEKNGFSQFKLTGDKEEEDGKKRFIMFSDIKDEKEKEMMLNAYNGSTNGSANGPAKVFIISATDAEGISLKNTRFVHIVEPPESTTRIDQVVGRARRLCSHSDLPKELQTVNAYLYISTMKDSTTIDEEIYEKANKRDNINKQILQAIKETAIDCSLYSSKENVVCYDLGSKSMTSHHKKVTISGGMSYLVDKENNLHDIETNRFVGKLKRDNNEDKFRIE